LLVRADVTRRGAVSMGRGLLSVLITVSTETVTA
jgi:hypothetical protein